LHARSEVFARAIERDLWADVRAKRKPCGSNSADRLNASRIDAGKHIHVRENRIQLADKRFGLRAADTEPRKPSNVMDVVNRDGH
jgi:hypothetical protein